MKSAPGSPVSTRPTLTTCGASPPRAPHRAARVTSTWSATRPPGTASRRSWPSTASTAPEGVGSREVRVERERAEREGSRPRVVAIQTARCRRSIHAPSLPQKPCCQVISSASSRRSWRGTNSQNARRPPMREKGGQCGQHGGAAIATPIAPTGPSPAVELTEAKERQSSAATTVPADATIPGPAARRPSCACPRGGGAPPDSAR